MCDSVGFFPFNQELGVRVAGEKKLQENLADAEERMSDSEMSFDVQLLKLYDEIHSCHVCLDMDPDKALRRIESVQAGMDVFIVSQALAEHQLRVTGVNFFTENGRPGQTGKMLERFLNQFGRTVFPKKSVYLGKGFTVDKAKPGFISVYNTDIAQCFPGKITRGDRPPSDEEIKECVGKGFLTREIQLIRPKLLLLMGNKSRKAFYEHVINDPRADTPTEHLNSIIESGGIPTERLADMSLRVLPIPHPAVRDRSFNDLIENKSLVAMIREVLEQS